MAFTKRELQRNNRKVYVNEPGKQPRMVEGHLNPDGKTWDVYDADTNQWETVPNEQIDLTTCTVPIDALQPPPSMPQYMAYCMNTNANTNQPCVTVGFGVTEEDALQAIQQQFEQTCTTGKQKSHLVKVVDLTMVSSFTIGR